ncbi:Gfo/Idh/MocA family protein [Rosistilla oblonga]|uniref:Gfo/Idh/MocA family protein n=1 Tax=Rosistilla oblonga TaxID=2527990 RepID=UPI003A97B8D3
MRAGIAGIGFMGWIHYLAYQRATGAELVAFCTRDPQRRGGDWTGIQGNFGPPGTQIDVSDLSVYETLDEMLENDSIDLIDICLPVHLHVDAVRKCLEAGKHVLCEKPLALNADDAASLVELAKSKGLHLMVAHVLAYLPEFRLLVDAQQSGKYGKCLGGRFKRVIGPVDWNPDFYNPEKVGGPLIDLHVHDAHLLRLLFGMPKEVISRGRMRGETASYFESMMTYDDPDVIVSVGGGTIDQHGRPFTHGYEVHFERATIQFEFAGFDDGTELMPVKIIHEGGKIERPELGSGDPADAFVIEVQTAADVLAGKDPGALAGQLAADALQICELELKSIKNNTSV